MARVAVDTSVPFTSNDFQHYNTKAKYIWFHRKHSIHCILRGHITAAESHVNVIMIRILHCIINIIWLTCLSKLWVTYYVPTTLRVLISASSLPNILAMPKSEILGVISLSRRILLVFKSLWMILYLESWWRYSKPRAIPSIIRYRVCQSSSLLLAVSEVTKIGCYLVLDRFGNSLARAVKGIPNRK